MHLHLCCMNFALACCSVINIVCVCLQLPQRSCTTKPTPAQFDWESDCCIPMCKETEWQCTSDHTCAATSNQHMHSVHGNQDVEAYAIQTLKCSAQPDTHAQLELESNCCNFMCKDITVAMQITP